MASRQELLAGASPGTGDVFWGEHAGGQLRRPWGRSHILLQKPASAKRKGFWLPVFSSKCLGKRKENLALRSGPRMVVPVPSPVCPLRGGSPQPGLLSELEGPCPGSWGSRRSGRGDSPSLCGLRELHPPPRFTSSPALLQKVTVVWFLWEGSGQGQSPPFEAPSPQGDHSVPPTPSFKQAIPTHVPNKKRKGILTLYQLWLF